MFESAIGMIIVVLTAMVLGYIAGRRIGYETGHKHGWQTGWKARKAVAFGKAYGMRNPIVDPKDPTHVTEGPLPTWTLRREGPPYLPLMSDAYTLGSLFVDLTTAEGEKRTFAGDDAIFVEKFLRELTRVRLHECGACGSRSRNGFSQMPKYTAPAAQVLKQAADTSAQQIASNLCVNTCESAACLESGTCGVYGRRWRS